MNYGKLAANSTEAPKKRVIGKPWPKGVSGNPKGRPKSKPITDMLREIFDHPEAVKEIKANVLTTLKSKGMAGVILLSHVADRLEGKIAEEVNVNLRDLSDDELTAKLEELEGGRTGPGTPDRKDRNKGRVSSPKKGKKAADVLPGNGSTSA